MYIENTMSENIKETRNEKVRWIRRIRQLTNEKIINLPKQLEFFQAGDRIALSFDGAKITIERI